MLRAVLLGVLSLSTVACKSKTDTSASSQPGAAAGKVIEVKGTVSVKHADATRALATGETVDGDDTVITGADGNVVIELAHNSARWELGPNKQQKVRDSIAWKAQKSTGSAEEVDLATAAAGRPAERNAAGTVATAEEAPSSAEAVKAPPSAEAVKGEPPAGAEPMPDMQPKGGDTPVQAPSRRRERAAAPKSPPPPSPSPPAKPDPLADDEAPTPRRTRGGTMKPESAAAPPARVPLRAPAPSANAAAADSGGGPDLSAPSGGGGGGSTPATLVSGKTSALHQCLVDNGATADVVVTVDVANGKPTIKVTSKAAISAGLDSCIKKVINGITFTGTAKVMKTIKP